MVLTTARAGIARSDATRSGYPVQLGKRLPHYALSGVARSNATRSNFHSPQVFVRIGGIHYGYGAENATDEAYPPGVLIASLTITDVLSEAPSTAAFTLRGAAPPIGTDVVITLGSKNNLRREFGGHILNGQQSYVADNPVAENVLHAMHAIDYTWGLTQTKFSGRYLAATVGAIAADLLLAVAGQGYTLRVDADIADAFIDEISFTETDVAGCFRQLVKRAGGDWLCDYVQIVRVFYDNSVDTPPSILNRVHASFTDLTITRDLSQVVTRVYGEGGGSNALEELSPGETVLPVGTASWYAPGGGVVLCGPQRITYGGIADGAGGSLIGPGAGPTTPVNVELLAGAGVNTGAHEYAVTFRTAAGESLASPHTAIVVGAVAAPPAALLRGTPTIGPGPAPGTHDYAVTFLTPSGETLPGARLSVATGVVPEPAAGPVPDSAASGTGPDPGPHEYAASFVTTEGGETKSSPIGPSITTGFNAAPTGAPGNEGTLPPPTLGALTPGLYDYGVTYVSAGGETTMGPTLPIDNRVPVAPESSPPYVWQGQDQTYWGQGDAGNIGDAVGYAVSYSTDPGTTGDDFTHDSALSPVSNIVVIEASIFWAGSTAKRTVQTSGTSDPAVKRQHLWVTVNGEPYRHVAPKEWGTLMGNGPLNVTVSATGRDTQTVPSPGAYTAATVALSGLASTADPQITAKRLYRRFNGAGPFLLVRQLEMAIQRFGTFAPGTAPTPIVQNAPGTITAGAHRYACTFVTAEGETSASAASASITITNPAVAGRVDVINVPTAPGGDAAGVTGRKLYRTAAGGSTYKYLGTLSGNVATYFADNLADASLGATLPTTNSTGDRIPQASLGAAAPSVNTALVAKVHLSSIPRQTGTLGPGIAARKLYRRSAGAGLRYLATLPDNAATTYTDTTPNSGLGAAPPASSTAWVQQIPLTLPIGGTLVTGRRVYRSPANVVDPLRLVLTVADNVTVDAVDAVPDSGLGANAPSVNTAAANQVRVWAIPLGPSSVLERRLYRTAVGGTQLRLLVILGDNVTATYLDVKADVALGADAPTSDASLLTQPSGNVLAGSTSLIVTGVGAFDAAGGWVLAGSQVIRYRGLGPNALTGVPASGPGAITTTISYNTSVVAAPLLTGIPASGPGAIRYGILKGDAVNLFIQEDDRDAQAALAAQLGRGTGIVEDEIQDRRLSETEMRARARARLELLAARDVEGYVGIVTIAYRCRDINTRAGREVEANLGPPIHLRGSYMIQHVTTSQYWVHGVLPTYDVEASSLHFSYEELLRRIKEN